MFLGDDRRLSSRCGPGQTESVGKLIEIVAADGRRGGTTKARTACALATEPRGRWHRNAKVRGLPAMRKLHLGKEIATRSTMVAARRRAPGEFSM